MQPYLPGHPHIIPTHPLSTDSLRVEASEGHCPHGIIFNMEMKMSVLCGALGYVLPFGFFVSFGIESDL